MTPFVNEKIEISQVSVSKFFVHDVCACTLKHARKEIHVKNSLETLRRIGFKIQKRGLLKSHENIKYKQTYSNT
jgi:hypothetical protein